MTETDPTLMNPGCYSTLALGVSVWQFNRLQVARTFQLGGSSQLMSSWLVTIWWVQTILNLLIQHDPSLTTVCSQFQSLLTVLRHCGTQIIAYDHKIKCPSTNSMAYGVQSKVSYNEPPWKDPGSRQACYEVSSMARASSCQLANNGCVSSHLINETGWSGWMRKFWFKCLMVCPVGHSLHPSVKQRKNRNLWPKSQQLLFWLTCQADCIIHYFPSLL